MAKLTLEEVKARVFEALPTVEIMDDVYINSKTKLSCRCKICGCEFSNQYHHLENLHGCPRCAGREQLTLDQAKKRIYDVSPNIEILSDVYTGVYGKLKCRCLIPDCGHEWDATPKHLFEAHSCPQCGIRKNSGKNHYAWKGGISPLHEHLRGSISEWKRDTMKASGYKCVITGDDFDHIHHIHGFDLILKETLQIEDLPIYPKISDYTERELLRIEKTCLELHYKYGLGVCLKESEHTLFHQHFGRGGNNYSQWQEFLELKRQEKAS